MLVLAIETAGASGSLAILSCEPGVEPEEASVLAQRRLVSSDADDRPPGSRREMGLLLGPALEAVLVEAGLRGKDLNAVVVDIGPGSYTGLRIGISAAKGFVLASGAALVGVVSLDALAVEAVAELPAAAEASEALAVVVASSARDVYLARYRVEARGRPARTDGPRMVPRADLGDELGRDPPTLLAGNAAPEAGAALEALELAVLAARDAPRVETVAREGLRRLVAGESDDLDSLVPLYLRASEPEERKKKQ